MGLSPRWSLARPIPCQSRLNSRGYFGPDDVARSCEGNVWARGRLSSTLRRGWEGRETGHGRHPLETCALNPIRERMGRGASSLERGQRIVLRRQPSSYCCLPRSPLKQEKGPAFLRVPYVPSSPGWHPKAPRTLRLRVSGTPSLIGTTPETHAPRGSSR